MDYTAMTDEELQEVIQHSVQELERRQVLQASVRQAAEANVKYLRASGEEVGGPWSAPTGAHDAYPKNWVVTHGGSSWVSLVPNNVWKPGVSGWRELQGEGDVPDWVQPTGAHDAYHLGNQVTYEGQIYESLTDNNVWAPDEYNTNWQLIEEEPDLDPEEPTPEEPEISDWVRPSGGHDAYSQGDQVMFEGAVYESLIDGNTWSPTEYPQGWKTI